MSSSLECIEMIKSQGTVMLSKVSSFSPFLRKFSQVKDYKDIWAPWMYRSSEERNCGNSGM